jgi:hypothetical protein
LAIGGRNYEAGSRNYEGEFFAAKAAKKEI